MKEDPLGSKLRENLKQLGFMIETCINPKEGGGIGYCLLLFKEDDLHKKPIPGGNCLMLSNIPPELHSIMASVLRSQAENMADDSREVEKHEVSYQ